MGGGAVVTGAASAYLAWQAGAGLARVAAAALASWAAARTLRVTGAVLALATAGLACHASLVRAGRTARLVCRLDGRVTRLLAVCPALAQPCYVPTFWAANRWTNLALHVFKQIYDKSSLRSNRFQRELLTMPDGGCVSVDFAPADHLPHDAPFVIFLHTITGSPLEVGHYTRAATARGWRSAVFTRRGHGGLRLATPRFSVLGDPADTRTQVEFVRSRHPHSFLAMVGVSAGSGLLFSYLGREADTTPVQAAVALCPAYDIRRAFRLAVNHPSMDQHILASMKRLFIQPNKEILCSKSPQNFSDCSTAKTVHEFIKLHSSFAGYDSPEEYYAESNPVHWIPQVRKAYCRPMPSYS